MRRRARCTALLLALGAGLAWAGEPGPAYEPLVRFPDVPPGGQFVVTHGTERPLRLLYGKGIEPTSLRATLNGRDVSRLFHPASRDRGDAVRLPLTLGDNALRIEVNSREAAANPRSALLPEEHVLNIRVVPMETRALMDVKTFNSQEEADAYLKAQETEILAQ